MPFGTTSEELQPKSTGSAKVRYLEPDCSMSLKVFSMPIGSAVGGYPYR